MITLDLTPEQISEISLYLTRQIHDDFKAHSANEDELYRMKDAVFALERELEQNGFYSR